MKTFYQCDVCLSLYIDRSTAATCQRKPYPSFKFEIGYVTKPALPPGAVYVVTERKQERHRNMYQIAYRGTPGNLGATCWQEEEALLPECNLNPPGTIKRRN